MADSFPTQRTIAVKATGGTAGRSDHLVRFPFGAFDGVGGFGQQDENSGKIAYVTFLFDDIVVERAD